MSLINIFKVLSTLLIWGFVFSALWFDLISGVGPLFFIGLALFFIFLSCVLSSWRNKQNLRKEAVLRVFISLFLGIAMVSLFFAIQIYVKRKAQSMNKGMSVSAISNEPLWMCDTDTQCEYLDCSDDRPPPYQTHGYAACVNNTCRCQSKIINEIILDDGSTKYIWAIPEK